MSPISVSHLLAAEGGGRVSPRAICFCVDDFGLSPGVNQAALSLAESGRVQAISCMTGGQAWAPSACTLSQFDSKKMDIGLHLDFTECPLLPGSRYSLPAMIAASYFRGLNLQAVRSEIRAQLDVFETALGHPPTFVDGHQHVHQLPGVRSQLLEELSVRYPGHPIWLRATHAPEGGNADGAWRTAVKPWVIEQLGARNLASRALTLGYGQNGRLLGVYDFKGGRERYAELLAAWFRSALNADLVMCHPSAMASDDDPINPARLAEFDVLSSNDFEVIRREARIELRPMSEILRMAHS